MTQQACPIYARPPRTPAAAPRPARWPRRSRSAIVDFYYDQFDALKSINLPLYDRKVTAFIGPSGCGKSTLLRVLNRIYDLYPEAAGHRRGAARWREHPGAGHGPEPAAGPGRHGVPEADAVSDVDLRQHRLRHPPLRDGSRTSRWTAASSGAAPRRVVGRGQGQAEAERPRPVGRPAAAPVHRARDRGQARR